MRQPLLSARGNVDSVDQRVNLFDLSGRIAVVIGGTSGLGRTISLGLARHGADVVVTGRRAEMVQAVTEEIHALGRKTLEHPADALSADSLLALRDRIEAELGQVSILVNAAGVTKRVPTAEAKLDDWNYIVQTNLNGTLLPCQIFREHLAESGHGRIINIASLSSFVAFHEVAAYGASKSAVLSLTKSLGSEWAKDGIRTNAIVPGVFVTDLNRALLEGTERGRELLQRTPLKRFGDAEELVGAAVFLASDACSFITGTHIAVDGGFLASGVNS